MLISDQILSRYSDYNINIIFKDENTRAAELRAYERVKVFAFTFFYQTDNDRLNYVKRSIQEGKSLGLSLTEIFEIRKEPIHNHLLIIGNDLKKRFNQSENHCNSSLYDIYVNEDFSSIKFCRTLEIYSNDFSPLAEDLSNEKPLLIDSLVGIEEMNSLLTKYQSDELM